MALHMILLWACFYGLMTTRFPSKPEGLSIIQSRTQGGVSISYKEGSNTYQQHSLIATD
jgi:hypothetical protein